MFERVNELLGTGYISDFGINWDELCYVDRMLPESFLEEFKNFLDWGSVSLYQTLSEDFIRKHKDLVNWGIISRSQLLSWDFIIEFKDRVSWRDISRFQPFIEDSSYKDIDVSELRMNQLYNLYQQTKERGWFLGFREVSINRKERGYRYFSYDMKRFRRCRYIKVRVFWKDLVKFNITREYEPIREVKYVQ